MMIGILARDSIYSSTTNALVRIILRFDHLLAPAVGPDQGWPSLRITLLGMVPAARTCQDSRVKHKLPTP